ncbi:hypothetical protein BS47DRAFT_1339499 [Hydnum rufescens UP504]|uniref:Uncharacterized protein n=1 Tax=Hydnum rufescens UP504 TaxID=1448309 RepID=A0A9P6B444_9AGAM|nr:hypothetical protein BS47DRAFT_1339499 [Hydnum rufescens UP504]
MIYVDASCCVPYRYYHHLQSFDTILAKHVDVGGKSSWPLRRWPRKNELRSPLLLRALI